MHDEICIYKNYGNHDTKVRKIRISHTCNYCFAFFEIASPSVHTIVLLKYRFDLQIGCWSFTEITFLDSDQTELFAFSIKISRSWNFLTCFVYDFLKFNTTEIAELACALFYWFVQRKIANQSQSPCNAGGFFAHYWASSQTLSKRKD